MFKKQTGRNFGAVWCFWAFFKILTFSKGEGTSWEQAPG